MRFRFDFVPLTVSPQSAVYELCSRAEERLQVKLRMVCSFNAEVLHIEVTVELLTCVDAVSTCRSVQDVGYTQRGEDVFISCHRPANTEYKPDLSEDGFAILHGAEYDLYWFSLLTRLRCRD